MLNIVCFTTLFWVKSFENAFKIYCLGIYSQGDLLFGVLWIVDYHPHKSGIEVLYLILNLTSNQWRETCRMGSYE